MLQKKLRVVLVDDSVAIRAGVPVLLPTCEVLALPNVESLLARPVETDVVALDLRLAFDEDGAIQGDEAVRSLAEQGYRICLYTDERRRLVLAQCLRAGALGVVHKADGPEVVLEALTEVAAGRVSITPSLAGLAELADRRGGMPELTDRQRQILKARARGEQWSSIASRLYITEGVAREHLSAATNKFVSYLQEVTPSELCHQLGLGSGDLIGD